MTTNDPDVAILIPCRNEEQHIARCLDSLLNGDFPTQRLDLVVIDGQSTDRTREIVANYAARFSCVRLLDNPEQNKPAALNLGIKATTADIVMRIDAHAVYAPDYVSRLVEGLAAFQVDNIGGVRESVPGKTAWSRAVSVATTHPLGAGNAVYRTGVRDDRPREVDTVFCGCYRREVFARLGGFHPRLLRTQDREFNARLLASGGRILLDPKVRCWYYPRASLLRYLRWTWQGAFWVYYADRYTTTTMRSWRNLAPMALVLWTAAAVGLWTAAFSWVWVLALPLVFYMSLVTGVAATVAARQRQAAMFPALLLLFPATHFAYGCGSIAGRLASWLLPGERTAPPRLRNSSGSKAAA